MEKWILETVRTSIDHQLHGVLAVLVSRRSTLRRCTFVAKKKKMLEDKREVEAADNAFFFRFIDQKCTCERRSSALICLATDFLTKELRVDWNTLESFSNKFRS